MTDSLATDHIVDSRVNYDRDQLDEATLPPEPWAQFRSWLDHALAEKDLVEPNAMTIATADGAGRPSARIVLLRGFDERGIVFFTNYLSRKGQDIEANPAAAALFYWDRLEREVRIEGRVERLSVDESDAYFARRPRGHRLSAWASPQSDIVAGRAALEAAMQEVETRFPDDVPRPPHWGGYRVVPASFEFWQGRRNRVHDRIVYLRVGEQWQLQRLAP